MTAAILGWDVGGANLKVVRLETDSRQVRVLEIPFELWRRPQDLTAKLIEMAAQVGGGNVMAMTMTAELADCFATKSEGVSSIIEAFCKAFPASELFVYGVDGVFRSPDDASRLPHLIAAANWMAGATMIGRAVSDAIFIDVGSTTTDIVPIVGGRVAATGRTDSERLSAGELVYTGALRTPICAIVRTVPLARRQCRVAAEYFAIAADAHLWLRNITEQDYTCETPDGRGCGRTEAGARLARMVCADAAVLGEDALTDIAEHVAGAQVAQISSAIRQVQRSLQEPARVAILAGRGQFLARSAALRARLAARDLLDVLPDADVGAAAPAAAVAYLLAETA